MARVKPSTRLDLVVGTSTICPPILLFPFLFFDRDVSFFPLSSSLLPFLHQVSSPLLPSPFHPSSFFFIFLPSLFLPHCLLLFPFYSQCYLKMVCCLTLSPVAGALTSQSSLSLWCILRLPSGFILLKVILIPSELSLTLCSLSRSVSYLPLSQSHEVRGGA